jgi:hypothetical protein
MKLTSKQLTKLKTKLALDGSGSKKRLAETLNLHQSQITFLLDTGKAPVDAMPKIINYLNK